ncbi:tyrosine-type recombinase/integrase [Methylacidiphilales bacterium]|nr:tyrosine-type recombinase/integrase [Candidatus Methylacidiphilales bacterium]
MNWVELYAKHLETRRLTERTIVSQRHSLQNFEAWLLNRYTVVDWREVTFDHIMAYAKKLDEHRKKDGSPTTKNHQYVQLYTLKTFFGFLKVTDRILIDPCANLPHLREGRSLPRGLLNAAEMMRLLQQPKITHPFGFRDRCILELLYSTGLRGKELASLTVHDVDLDGRFVRVHKGKGGKDRIVPIGKAAVAYLREYLLRVRPLMFRSHPGRQAVERLFISTRRTAIHSGILWKMVRRYVRLAGLPSNVSTHSLRHSCATEMLRGGASIRHVQEMLGHSQLRTTQLYTRVLPVDLKAIHQKTAPSERRRSVDIPNSTLLP